MSHIKEAIAHDRAMLRGLMLGRNYMFADNEAGLLDVAESLRREIRVALSGDPLVTTIPTKSTV